MSVLDYLKSTVSTKGRRIQIKQGLKKDFSDSVLEVGEFGLILDENELRIGLADGTTMVVNGGTAEESQLDSHKELLASTVTLGHVKVGTNINVANGVISVANASTSTKGLVQLNDTLTSTSTTLALTAKQGNELKKLIDDIASNSGSGGITLADIPDASATQKGLMTSALYLKLNGISSGANFTQVVDNLTSTSTTSALSAYQGKIINDKLEKHINDVMLHNGELNQYITNPDENNTYRTVTFKRTDGTNYMISNLSNPDSNGNYQTLVWEFYATNGTTKTLTKTWTMTYDTEGNITSKVVS